MFKPFNFTVRIPKSRPIGFEPITSPLQVEEIIDWEIILSRSDKLAKDVLKQEEKENIWEIVEDWWTTLFKTLYFY